LLFPPLLRKSVTQSKPLGKHSSIAQNNNGVTAQKLLPALIVYSFPFSASLRFFFYSLFFSAFNRLA